MKRHSGDTGALCPHCTGVRLALLPRRPGTASSATTHTCGRLGQLYRGIEDRRTLERAVRKQRIRQESCAMGETRNPALEATDWGPLISNRTVATGGHAEGDHLYPSWFCPTVGIAEPSTRGLGVVCLHCVIISKNKAEK